MQNPARTVEIIGVPSDLGANIRGACMGPSAIRIAGLGRLIKELGLQVIDRGDLPVPIRETLPIKDHQEKFLHPIQELCESLAQKTQSALERGHMPIILGGDHSIALGTIGGVSAYMKSRQKKMGLVWIDAHADINTHDSSPTGNIHGMPLAALLGMGRPEITAIAGPGPKVEARNVALIGVRTIDELEKENLRKSGIHYFNMRHIDEKGMFHVMQEAIRVASDGTAGIHVSFDIDGIDPAFAPGVSTPVDGGLNFRECHLILEMLHETGKICSLEIVELNPATDEGGQSAHLAAHLILSALGKAIV